MPDASNEVTDEFSKNEETLNILQNKATFVLKRDSGLFKSLKHMTPAPKAGDGLSSVGSIDMTIHETDRDLQNTERF